MKCTTDVCCQLDSSQLSGEKCTSQRMHVMKIHSTLNWAVQIAWLMMPDCGAVCYELSRGVDSSLFVTLVRFGRFCILLDLKFMNKACANCILITLIMF